MAKTEALGGSCKEAIVLIMKIRMRCVQGHSKLGLGSPAWPLFTLSYPIIQRQYSLLALEEKQVFIGKHERMKNTHFPWSGRVMALSACQIRLAAGMKVELIDAREQIQIH